MLKLASWSRGIANIPAMTRSDSALGNLTDIADTGSLHQFLVAQHNNHGNAFSFFWGDQEVVSLGHPRLWMSVVDLSHRPRLAFQYPEAVIGASSTYYTNGEEWKNRRNTQQDPAFSQNSIENLHYDVFRRNVKEELFPKIESVINADLPLYSTWMQIALDSLVRSSLGIDTTQEAIDLIDAKFNPIMDNIDMFRINSESQQTFQQEFREIINKTIENRGSSSKGKTFIDYLQQDPNPDLPTADFISFLVGGVQTTGSTLYWLLDCLGRNPDCQQKLQREIDSSVTGKIVTLNEIARLKYFRNCLNETLRFTAQGNIATRVSPDRDIKLSNGATIPAGMPILLALGKVMHDPELWHDPDTFNPDRFASMKVRMPFLLSPFGVAGSRMCPGRSLTNAYTSVVVGSIFKNYNLTIKDHTVPDRQYGFVTKPSCEVYGTFSKR